MTKRMVQLLDIHDSDDQDLFEASHKFNCEANGNGNDSFYSWVVVLEPTGDDEGWGYLTDAETKLINDWALSQDAVIDETIIINHWW